MRTVKPEVRLLGVDDAAFEFADDSTELVGTVFRGSRHLEGVLIDEITVDGFDVTETVVSMVSESRHRDQIQAVLLDGITFGGFNIADIYRIADDTGVGVVAVSRNEPDRDRFADGLENVNRSAERLEIVEETGDAKPHSLEGGTIYFQHAGVPEEQVHDLLDVARDRSLIPEPVRVAHLIAGALKNGESKGRV